MMTDSTHTDLICSSCNTIATSLTECDHCRKWNCQSRSKLPKSTLNKMTALQKSGFYWFCTNCRTDHRPSQRKILSNSSSQTYHMSFPPIYKNHSLHLHHTYIHNPLFLHLHSSPHYPSFNPKPYPSQPLMLTLFLPSLLSPLAYPILPLNDYNPSLP